MYQNIFFMQWYVFKLLYYLSLRESIRRIYKRCLSNFQSQLMMHLCWPTIDNLLMFIISSPLKPNLTPMPSNSYIFFFFFASLVLPQLNANFKSSRDSEPVIWATLFYAPYNFVIYILWLQSLHLLELGS